MCWTVRASTGRGCPASPGRAGAAGRQARAASGIISGCFSLPTPGIPPPGVLLHGPHTMPHTITVIRGDGIGPELMDATLPVPDAMGQDLAYEEADGGVAALATNGQRSDERRGGTEWVRPGRN